MTKTRVYEVLGSRRRIVNTIDFGSCFRNLPWTANADMNDPEVQMKAGLEIADMWRRNGPEPHATYVVEQTDR